MQVTNLTQLAPTEHTTQKSKSTFFSSTHKTFTNTDHILGHKISFNKFKHQDCRKTVFIFLSLSYKLVVAAMGPGGGGPQKRKVFSLSLKNQHTNTHTLQHFILFSSLTQSAKAKRLSLTERPSLMTLTCRDLGTLNPPFNYTAFLVGQISL